LRDATRSWSNAIKAKTYEQAIYELEA
jgi:hypothetical protein